MGSTHRVIGKRHRCTPEGALGQEQTVRVLEVGDACSPSAAELASFPDRFAPILVAAAEAEAEDGKSAGKKGRKSAAKG